MVLLEISLTEASSDQVLRFCPSVGIPQWPAVVDESHDHWWTLEVMASSTSSPHQRRVDGHALVGVLPALALIPSWLLSIAIIWWAVSLAWTVSFPVFALLIFVTGGLLFVRPVQKIVLQRLLGARTPTAAERAVLQRAWLVVAQANHIPAGKYVLAVTDSDELNAFASGGHLMVVSSWAVENLDHDELCGVLAHELCHHLGMHTIALTVAQWLTLPVVLIAQIGFFLQNIAHAATDSFARKSGWADVLGRTVAGLLTIVSWLFLAMITISQMIGNVVGRGAEFAADEAVVRMGFGKELRNALRRVIAASDNTPGTRWRDKLYVTHPAARTRVARIDAQLRMRDSRR